MPDDDDARLVRPDGNAVRALRHARGWSPRDLVDAIGEAQRTATGLRQTIAPALLAAVEERDARIPYATLRLIAGGFDCNPVELLGPDGAEERAPAESGESLRARRSEAGSPRSRSSARSRRGARAPGPPRGTASRS
jgi:transcriptional regulator with XRE-family HTH domain